MDAMTPALAAFSLWLHLAGAAPYGDAQHYATLSLCQRAGEAWLARVRERSPNDWYECVEVKR